MLSLIHISRKKEEIVKVKVRPVLIKDVLFFQCETHKNRQVFHENYEYEQALHILAQDMELFRQMQIETKEFKYTVLVSKNGKVSVQKKRTKGEKRDVYKRQPDVHLNTEIYKSSREP